MNQPLQALSISLNGLVQGVGFRPFVYLLAQKHHIRGWVRNTGDGVEIFAESSPAQLQQFVNELENDTPEAASIHRLERRQVQPRGLDHFEIRSSRNESQEITQVSADIAVCEACLHDMVHQPHRLHYPLLNCTHCGPRFTIIRELPYDRDHTTMAPFALCETCRSEYEDVHDRRFHAQPVACNRCGPRYKLWLNGKHIGDMLAVIASTRQCIHDGGILAIKGLGGFFLMCDATNAAAVKRLREVKLRNAKPFAVMAADTATVRRFALMNSDEEKLLGSWRRPIVLLRPKTGVGRGADSAHGPGTGVEGGAGANVETAASTHGAPGLPDSPPLLAAGIYDGCPSLGVMLPYMPFHHLFFSADLPVNPAPVPVVVMTSGNLSEEPILTDNDQARTLFTGMADGLVTYNRAIHNRADDSVAFSSGGKTRLIRRSRGFVPEPVHLSFRVDGIFAAGAELNHCFALGKGQQALLSQHIGDLKDPETYAFFEETFERLTHLFRFSASEIACDRHPDYLSTRFARQKAHSGHAELPVKAIQHHHAHVAAVMAEHDLNSPVIGICWDGTGLGDDGHIWGGEFFHGDYRSMQRCAHLDYLPLPGGDKAARETWRCGLSLLLRTFGAEFRHAGIPFVEEVLRRPQTTLLLQAMDKHLNTPLSSGMGRLFDAVAALLMVCDTNRFHAEAPMRLEALVDESERGTYAWQVHRPGAGCSMERGGEPGAGGTSMHGGLSAGGGSGAGGGSVTQVARSSDSSCIDIRPMVRDLVNDLRAGVPTPIISTRFHNTLAAMLLEQALEVRARFGTNKVVLCGGVFQNRYLLEQSEKALSAHFDVYSAERIPSNDAGIALGQMAVAAHWPGGTGS